MGSIKRKSRARLAQEAISQLNIPESHQPGKRRLLGLPFAPAAGTRIPCRNSTNAIEAV